MTKHRLVFAGTLLATSGACALVYQVTWLRELRLVFGSTSSASAAVIAIFMGGLGLGNALFGRRADVHPNPLALYARFEAGISIAALLTPWLVNASRWAYIQLGGQSSLGELGATGLRLAVSAGILLIPTVLMGGTLPAAVAAVTVASDGNRRAVAVLYAVNTLGAVAGAMLSTFIALPILGTRATLWTACALNGAVAACAWLVSRGWGSPLGLPTCDTPSAPARNEPGRSTATKPGVLPGVTNAAAPPGLTKPGSRSIYVAAAVTGMSFMLMELVWYRMLAPILGGTTFTFGLILAVALLGIGIGGVLYPVLFRKRTPDLHALAATCGLEALCLAIPLALGDRLALATALLHDANSAGFLREVLAWAAIASIVVLPAAIVSGVQFPLLIALLGRGDEKVGSQVGWTYAANTLGGIIGSLAGGFGLLPLLSATGTWRAVVVLLAVLSAGLTAQAQRMLRRGRFGLSSFGWGVTALLLITFTGPTAVWRHSGIGAGRSQFPNPPTANSIRAWENRKRREVVWEADGVEAGVAMVVNNGLSFVVNGKNDGNAVGDAGTQIWLGLLPAILHPQPTDCLVVGLGSGETGGWLGQVPGIRQVDVVEIEPAISQMAERCAAVNGDVLNNPRVRILYNDAREVLLTTRDRYDIIASEPSNPYRAGISSLFTREFYAAAANRLKPDGLFIQWLQGYEIDEQTVQTVFATLKSEFAHVELWQSKHDDMLLVCSREPFHYSEEQLRQRVGQEPFRSGLAFAWRATNLEGLLARYVANQRLIDDVGRAARRSNSDDRNEIEYGFARNLGRTSGFAVATLRDRAVALGAHRPTGNFANVNWEAVDDEYLAMYAVLHRVLPPVSPGLETPSSRRMMFERYLKSDLSGAIAAWEADSRQPVGPTETAFLALAYAESGSDKARALAKALESYNPRESQMIHGIRQWRQGRLQAAAASLEMAFAGLRTDPWAIIDVTRHAIRSAVELASSDADVARRLLKTLEQPFGAMYADDLRRGAACMIASRLSPEAAVPLFEGYEPFPNWTDAFLRLRVETYVRARHPLRWRAQADLDEFVRHETGSRESRTLGKLPQTASLER